MLTQAGSKDIPTSMRNSFQRPGCIGQAPDSHRCQLRAGAQTRAAAAACVMPTRVRRARICWGVGECMSGNQRMYWVEIVVLAAVQLAEVNKPPLSIALVNFLGQLLQMSGKLGLNRLGVVSFHFHSPVCGVWSGGGQRFDGVAGLLPVVVHDVAGAGLVDAAIHQDGHGFIHQVAIGLGETLGVFEGEHFESPVSVTAPCCIHDSNIYHGDVLYKKKIVTVEAVEALC